MFVCCLFFFGVFSCDGLFLADCRPVVLLSVHVRRRAGRRRHLVHDAADVTGHVHRALLVHLDERVPLRAGRGEGKGRQKESTAALAALQWQGLTSSSLYFGLLDSSFVRLRGQKHSSMRCSSQPWPAEGVADCSQLGLFRECRRSPHVDKGDELGREASLLGVAELRRVAPHHLSQLVEHAVPLGVGEAAGGQLVLGHTHTHTTSGSAGG